jgi:hypothetical protein
VAVGRETEAPARLRKQLAGDLDNIILMAMRKEPERRYSSVEQFSEDLRCHLEGLRVIARGDSLSYRLGKFARRQKLGIAAIALVALSLTGAAVATAHEARVARKERESAAVARARAEQALSEAHASRLEVEAQRKEAVRQQILAEAQRDEALCQRSVAERQRDEAEAKRIRAERLFSHARNMSNAAFDGMYDGVQHHRNTAEARKTLIRPAIEYLDGMTQEP